MARKTEDSLRVFATNRQARFNYHITEVFEAGMVLTGPEVKSVREGKVVLKDAFAVIKGSEAYLQNAHISPYVYATSLPQDPERPRKLLLHRRELLKMEQKTRREGFTLVPLRLYLKNGVIKCELGLAKGKKQHDKRATQKADSARREMRDAMGRQRKGL